MNLTLGVIGISLRAAAVFPCVTCIVPLQPWPRFNSPAQTEALFRRIPLSTKTVAMGARGWGRFKVPSLFSGLTTRSR